jgi:hypothetical protein
MRRKGEHTDASCSTPTRPEQKGQKGDAALDESHDLAVHYRTLFTKSLEK